MDGQQYLVLILSSVTIYMKNVLSFNWINIGLNLYLEQKWRKVKKVFLTFIECDSNTVICAMILFHRQYRLYDPHIGNGVNKRKKEREREKKHIISPHSFEIHFWSDFNWEPISFVQALFCRLRSLFKYVL